jgi:GNAT superfamily N-acetyltransferase
MLEAYRPEYFDTVKAFARRQPNFGYVREIIRYHTKDEMPGGCWVWRKDKDILAFCGMAYLNRDDAWLYGMRVDDRCKGQGIASKFTRELYKIARAAGRTWAGLNTLDHRKPAPVFRIAEKLGMHLHAVHATDPFWSLPRRFKPRRLKRRRNILHHFAKAGNTTLFRVRPAWTWIRLLPKRRQEIDRHGFQVAGIPVYVERHGPIQDRWGRFYPVTVNFYDRPADFKPLLEALFGYAAGKRHGVTLNYPAEWKREVRLAAKELVPGLKRGKNWWPTAWRIYGKELSRRI